MTNVHTYESWHQEWSVFDGDDALTALPRLLDDWATQRCLLVASRSLSHTGVLAGEVATLVGDKLAGRYHEIVPHVPRGSALRLADELRAREVDTVVALGGGSVVDTVKAAVLAVTMGCRFEADFDALVRQPGFGPRLRAPVSNPVRVVALPTTLSGAEFSSSAGVVDPSRQVKELYCYDWLAPDAVVLAPQLARETPLDVWHATGLKLFSDAIEQTYGRRSHEVVTVLALEAARRLVRVLPGESNRDPSAALACFRAAWFSMFGVFNAQTFPGAAAALRHQVGARTKAPHGKIAAVLLPHVLRFNLPACADRLPAIADALGAKDTVESVVWAVETLRDSTEVPRTLRELAVPETDLPEIAELAAGSFAGSNNPRAASAPDLLSILRDAY